jgi:glutathione synthase/RimK-type ligase-like ATP-grasp enzyme
MRPGIKRIAIATCAAFGDLKVDDQLLEKAIVERGVRPSPIVWDGDPLPWDWFDGCIVRSTWDYHDKHAEFLAWTRETAAQTRLWNPPELIVWNSEKTYLRDLAEAGVPIVPTVWVGRDAGVDLEAVLRDEGWEEAVVKPAVDLGASNLHRVRAGEGSSALELALARSAEAMVQPFLPSLEAEGELSLIYIDGRFTHAVRKRPAPGDFRVQSIWGGTVKRLEPGAAELEIAEQALAQIEEVPLYARADLVAGPDDKPCLIELELIEPNLYLTAHPPAAAALAEALLLRIDVDA